VPSAVPKRRNDVVIDVVERVIAVDESEIDRASTMVIVPAEELLAGALVVRHDPLDSESREVRTHLLGIMPEVGAADGLGGAVAEEGIGRIHEAQLPCPVVLQPKRETDDAEPVP